MAVASWSSRNCNEDSVGSHTRNAALSVIAGASIASPLWFWICVINTDLTTNGSLAGSAGMFTPGVTFGSGISYANGTTFLLQ
jgi:hypothetical protein